MVKNKSSILSSLKRRITKAKRRLKKGVRRAKTLANAAKKKKQTAKATTTVRATKVQAKVQAEKLSKAQQIEQQYAKLESAINSKQKEIQVIESQMKTASENQRVALKSKSKALRADLSELIKQAYRKNPSFEEIYAHCQNCNEYKKANELTKHGSLKVCKKCKKKFDDARAKKSQGNLFDEQKTLFNPSRRKKNVEMGFYSGGQFHPIRASKDYNEFLGGDFDGKEERTKRRKENKKIAFYKELSQNKNREERLKKKFSTRGQTKSKREEKRWAELDDMTSLAKFVRQHKGIKNSRSGMFKGELDSLRPKESGTTGLVNKHSSFTASHMMEIANEAGYRNRDGSQFTNVGDFLSAIYDDATTKKKFYAFGGASYGNPTKRKKNVEMGFRDARGFHPIRASKDYDHSKAGEKSTGVSTRLGSVVAASKRKAKRAATNPYTPKSVTKIRKEFAGQSQGKSDEWITPSDTPKDVAQLGKLVEIKIIGRKPTLKFNNNPAMLGAYSNGGRRRMVIGLKKNYAVQNPEQGDVVLGEVRHVVYRCAKPHLGHDKVVPFIHKMGEEGGKRPVLIFTKEGLLKLRGGDYTIKPEGIRN